MATVVKVGGSILRNGADSGLMKAISGLADEGLIVVHGGGPVVTDLCRDLGIEPRFVVSPGGIRSRFTDQQTISAYVMAMKGKINSDIVLSMQKNGVMAFGMSGIDGPSLVAERKKRLLIINEKGRKMFIDGGYTGRIVSVDSTLISSLVSEGFVPVVSPIAASLEHEPLNVDGDRAASALSGALGADRLILLTNVDGVNIDGKTVREISLQELPEIISQVGNGMDRKLIAAREALESGTKEVIIANGNDQDALGNADNSEKRTVIKK